MTRQQIQSALLVSLAFGHAACVGEDPLSDDTLSETSANATLAAVQVAEDSYVSTFSAVQRGSRVELKVGATPERQVSYLKFVVAGIPQGATAIKATLKLRSESTASNTVEAHAANSSSWSEATLTDANDPGYASTVLSKISSTTKASTVSFDVSAAVKGNGTVSIALVTPSGGTTVFASKEAGTTAAPTLTISYTPAPVVTTMFGASYNPHTDARFDQLSNMWGGPLKIVRSFDNGNGVAPYLNTYQAQDIANKAASNYSFKYLPKEVLAGTRDAEIRGFFQGIKDGQKVYWTYYHEPDDQIYKSGAFTATDYRNAWKRIKNIANEVKATRPKLDIMATLVIMTYSMTPKIAPSRPLTGSNGMYPGDDVIDVFGVDGYNTGSSSGIVEDAASAWGAAIDFAQAHGKPWAIAEIGVCPVAGKPDGAAQFYRQSFAYFKARNYPPLYVAQFNVDWSASTCDYRFDGDAKATAVWKQAVTQGLGSF